MAWLRTALLVGGLVAILVGAVEMAEGRRDFMPGLFTALGGLTALLGLGGTYRLGHADRARGRELAILAALPDEIVEGVFGDGTARPRPAPRPPAPPRVRVTPASPPPPRAERGPPPARPLPPPPQVEAIDYDPESGE
jgi:hypothetical protein